MTLTVEEFLAAEAILAEPPGCQYQFTALSPDLLMYAKFQVNPITGSVRNSTCEIL